MTPSLGADGRHRGSAIGAQYRHTTPEAAARAVAAIEERLLIVVRTAEAALDDAHGGHTRSALAAAVPKLLAEDAGREGGRGVVAGGAEGI
jgi:hypothetical protein